MINPRLLLKHIIRPVLAGMEEFDPGISRSPVDFFLLGTAVQETMLRTRAQYGNGPAKSLWQIEPATANDVFDRYIIKRPGLHHYISNLSTFNRAVMEEIEVNDFFACAVARCIYRYRPGWVDSPLSSWDLAVWWKNRYNTVAGKGNPKSFEFLYNRHVLPIVEEELDSGNLEAKR